MLRIGLLFLAAMLGLSGAAGSLSAPTETFGLTAAAQGNPGQPSIQVWLKNWTDANPRGVRRLVGNGFSALTSVEIRWDNTPYATANTYDDGTFDLSLGVPFNGLGEHTVTAVGQDGRTASVTFVVADLGSWLPSAEGPIDEGVWEAVTQRAGYLYSLSFVDSGHGWALRDQPLPGDMPEQEGLVVHTVDGGLTWETQDASPRGKLVAVTFVDLDNGWAIGDQGAILHTSDGGDTWQSQESGTSNQLTSVFFLDNNRGWVTGWNKTFLRTGDGGQTWERVSIPVGLGSVVFVDSTTGWAAGGTSAWHTTDGGNTWMEQATGSDMPLFALDFVDAQNGWAVGGLSQPPVPASNEKGKSATYTRYGGMVLRTSDGGQTWTEQYWHPWGPLHSVAFTDAVNGWALGYESLVLHTADGGQTWRAPAAAHFSWRPAAIDFLDSNTGWLAGWPGEVLGTRDGGQSWTPLSPGGWARLRALDMVDPSTGWAAGDYGAILRTRDGATWIAQDSGTSADFKGVSFVDGNKGWAVGTQGTILHTGNSGNTWTGQDSRTAEVLSDVHFANTDHGWAVGTAGVVVHTVDGGSTWILQNSGTNEWLRGVAFADASRGWAVGWAGTILRTENGGATWAKQEAGSVVDLLGISVLSDNEAWVVGSGFLFHTQDGGQTWAPLKIPYGLSYRSVAFVDERVGWLAGGNSGVARTTDGGRTWTEQGQATTPSVYAEAVDGVAPDAATTVGWYAILKYLGPDRLGSIRGDIRLQGRNTFEGIYVRRAQNLYAMVWPDGSFAFTRLLLGTYDLAATGPKSLPATWAGVLVEPNKTTTLNQLVLLGGDVDISGEVDVADLAIVAQSFGQEHPADWRPDANGDSVVDIMDLVLVGLNFGKTESPWPGEPEGN